ncbi:MAG TPA: alternative ribosome rescue aminoacyl-tRNA hydrolase ArfB [Phycisphaerales bacterium]|nr:alternative ribosome rescue aminoacyl-tRNA hydrolase ArfB [Phycisphaerales bacterium]
MASPEPHPAPAPEPSGCRLAPGVFIPEAALGFSFTRSGGPGGQNVNKLATKAELRVALADIPVRPRARARLARLAGRRLSETGELVLVCESERSQRRNREECLEKLRQLVQAALPEPVPRKKTRPTRSSVERRLESKRVRGERKARRRSPDE